MEWFWAFMVLLAASIIVRFMPPPGHVRERYYGSAFFTAGWLILLVIFLVRAT